MRNCMRNCMRRMVTPKDWGSPLHEEHEKNVYTNGLLLQSFPVAVLFMLFLHRTDIQLAAVQLDGFLILIETAMRTG